MIYRTREGLFNESKLPLITVSPSPPFIKVILMLFTLYTELLALRGVWYIVASNIKVLLGVFGIIENSDL